MSRRRLLAILCASEDRGATLILSAVFMVVVVIIAAIVIDLGHERMMRRSAQSVADMAALAGSQTLSQPEGPMPVEACQEALEYLKLNISHLPASAAMPCTSIDDGLPVSADGAVSCTEDTPRRTITDGGTARPYVLTISWPIPDADIADDRVSDPRGLREFDGREPDDQCDRFAVDVQIEQSRFFSRFLSDGDLSGSAEAVARRLPYSDVRIPNLWLLEPYECDVLKVSGTTTRLRVGDLDTSGLITADSDGSACRNNTYVIDTEGGAQVDAIPNLEPPGNPNELDPPGEISLYAMRSGQLGCVSDPATGNVNACNPASVAGGSGVPGIDPEPQRRPTRATRAPVDWTYNCKEGYPEYHDITIVDCAEGSSRPPYVDLLHEWVSSNVTSASQPGGWTRYGDDPGEPCNLGNNADAVLSGNVVVDCKPLRLSSTGVFAVTGGNVVFRHGVVMTGGTLVVNRSVQVDGAGKVLRDASGKPTVGPSTAPTDLPASECSTGAGFLTSCFKHAAATAAWMYQVEGNFDMRGGAVRLSDVTFVQEVPSTGTNDLRASSAGVDVAWSAPSGGPFRGLALWSESSSTAYGIGGSGATIDLEGVFFTPEAYPFTLTGGSSLQPQAAQFVSRTLKVTGGGTLALRPLGAPLVELPPPASVLIR